MGRLVAKRVIVVAGALLFTSGVATAQTSPSTTRAAVTAPAGPSRPQTPQPPFPYTVTHLFVPGPAGNIGATLTEPQTPGQHPAIVLISGSGPNDRDETIYDHKPFLLWADRLTRAGFAVLRYDKRGIGKSAGDYVHATTFDFAEDADAAVKFLAARDGIGSIGLLGHSEGGLIAPMVAARNPAVRFIVLLAGPGVRGDRILELQTAAAIRLQGGKPIFVDEKLRQLREQLSLVRAGDRAGLEALLLKQKMGDAQPGAPATRPAKLDKLAAQEAAALTVPWMTCFVTLDPAGALAKVQVPVLAVNGTLDFQVDAAENLTAIERALPEATRAKSTIRQLPGLNHLLQPAKTGAGMEYSRIETTVDESALSLVVAWCQRRAGDTPATRP